MNRVWALQKDHYNDIRMINSEKVKVKDKAQPKSWEELPLETSRHGRKSGKTLSTPLELEGDAWDQFMETSAKMMADEAAKEAKKTEERGRLGKIGLQK